VVTSTTPITGRKCVGSGVTEGVAVGSGEYVGREVNVAVGRAVEVRVGKSGVFDGLRSTGNSVGVGIGATGEVDAGRQPASIPRRNAPTTVNIDRVEIR